MRRFFLALARGAGAGGAYGGRRWRRPRKALARGELEAYRFHLAERLGMTVARLEREMGAKELAQWMAYDRYRAGRREQAAAKARRVGQVGEGRARDPLTKGPELQ